MFPTFWTDPLVYALNPNSRPLVLIGLVVLCVVWVVWELGRNHPARVALGGTLAFVFLLCASAESVRAILLARDLRRVISGAELQVEFHGERITFTRPAVWEEGRLLGRPVRKRAPSLSVTIYRDNLPRIEAVLKNEGIDLAARMSPAPLRGGTGSDGAPEAAEPS